MNSLFEINESELKEAAYKKFKSNYIVEADVISAQETVTVDGDNEAIKAIKEALDLDGGWKSQWIVNNQDDSYTIRFDKQDFRPVIVTFRPTIGNSMTFTIQFGEDGNCDYFSDDTPPDDPIVEIARYVGDANSRFAAMAEQFRDKTAELEREAGDKKAKEDEETANDADAMQAADSQPDDGAVPPPPGV